MFASHAPVVTFRLPGQDNRRLMSVLLVPMDIIPLPDRGNLPGMFVPPALPVHIPLRQANPVIQPVLPAMPVNIPLHRRLAPTTSASVALLEDGRRQWPQIPATSVLRAEKDATLRRLVKAQT